MRGSFPNNFDFSTCDGSSRLINNLAENRNGLHFIIDLFQLSAPFANVSFLISLRAKRREACRAAESNHHQTIGKLLSHIILRLGSLETACRLHFSPIAKLATMFDR